MGRCNPIISQGELRDYLELVSESGVKIAVKPQYVDKLPRLWDGEVRGLLERVDDRGQLEDYAAKTSISHILERKLSGLSGGNCSESRFAPRY